MREYTGPLPPGSRPTPPRPPARKGWVELDDETPCPACGELLIAPYATVETISGKEFTTYGPERCRNACGTRARP